jgi:hypothetical protein
MLLGEWLERHQRRLPGLAGALGRARKAFARMDLLSLEQLCAYTPAELLRVPWLGPVTVAVLEELLAEDGLRLRDRR